MGLSFACDGEMQSTFQHASTRKARLRTHPCRLSSRTPVNQGSFMVYN